ncbi:unnamed protein product [Rotaria socialis]|uniref:Death domain-containing protein n=2 Tax=Rotaria socialis TaxID=392032 RepID=A0A817TT73_9BILA|nr:unnamed protein product [Rotaria socialis]CAF4495018.1 unnamed protein product [Rotaria socialis]
METQAVSAADESEINKKRMNSTDNILQLNDYISVHRHDGSDRHFLNLDRCLRQPYTINHVSNNETIAGISLMYNYLIQIPTFVSDYTNLVELNASHNELSDTEFILYRSLDDNELTESYWDDFFKINSNYQGPENPYSVNREHCRTNEQTKGLSANTANIGKHSKPPTPSPNKQIPRPLVHPFLERINFSFNHIRFLPANIHYLRFLHTLNLSNNYLKELPSNIGFLEQLNTLTLNHNYLEILPATFSRLTQLQSLDLSYNSLQSIDLIKNFLNLKHFSIDSNPLKLFPMLLHTCSNLEDLSFSNTQLKQINNITLEIFNQFSKLKKLDLSKNNLNDDFLASSIQPFDYLEELHIQHNQFTNIFSLLSTTKSLRLLDLSYNSLEHIPQCTNSNLEILHLSHNKIELHPNECIYLKTIIELDLGHNQIEHVPNEFIQCVNLRSLNIAFNQLHAFPKIILQLRSLNKLVINHSKFQHLTTKDLFDKYFYRTINILNLSSNHLQTNLHELTGLKALTSLDLSHNQLLEIDEDFKLLSCLKILKLNNNRFSSFPSCLHEMSNGEDEKYIAETLMELYLNDNRIESIPEDIFHMTNLQTIDISNNQLMKFPDPLVYLEQLTSLAYSQQNGKHIGRLPADFINLCNLKKLDLSHNIFKDVPNVVYNLTKLEYLNMSYNLLSSVDNNRLKRLNNFKTLKLNGNNFVSFSSTLYQLETLNMNENSMCLAPPNDFIDENYISATSNLYVQINDQHETNMFEIYQQIFIEHLTSYDIENLAKRLKLSETDMNNFRNNSTNLKRDSKIEVLLNIWKDKRGSLANSDTLYRLAHLIGDKNLVRHMHRAYLLARNIRL